MRRLPHGFLILCIVVVVTSGVAAGTAAVPATGGAAPADVANGATPATTPENGSVASGSDAPPERADESGPTASSSPVIGFTNTYSLTPNDPGTVRVVHEVDTPSNLASLTLTPGTYIDGPYAVESATGFTQNASTGAWEWDETTSTPTMTLTVTVNETANVGYDGVDTGSWAFFRGVFIRHTWTYYVSDGEPTTDRTHVAATTGYAGEEFVYLGGYSTHSASSSAESFTLVETDPASPVESPSAVLSALTAVSDDFDVGGQDGSLTVFLVPDPMRRGGATVGNDFWYHHGADLQGTDSVIFHEYVHSQQVFERGVDSEWLIEASASYYEGYLAWKDGYATDTEFRDYVATGGYSSAVIVDANEFATEDKNYQKGRRVLGALDREIRQRTGGSKDLRDVMRRVNGHSGTLTYADFADAVEATAGESMDAWLDRYLKSSDVPTIGNTSTFLAPFDATSGNGRPTADVSGPTGVEENGTITLSATGSSDPDGDSLTYVWTQTDGPAVSLSGATTDTVTVTAPEVSSNRTVTLELQVDDGNGGTDTARVTLTVFDGATGPPPVLGSAPGDPDGDGRYEDVNADGAVDILDVQALYVSRDDPAVRDNGRYYDFNDDGRFSLLDVQAFYVATV